MTTTFAIDLSLAVSKLKEYFFKSTCILELSQFKDCEKKKQYCFESFTFVLSV